ncbi:hypothetical protein ACFVW2_30190 [Streptomyces sp. NPDC058171]
MTSGKILDVWANASRRCTPVPRSFREPVAPHPSPDESDAAANPET